MCISVPMSGEVQTDQYIYKSPNLLIGIIILDMNFTLLALYFQFTPK